MIRARAERGQKPYTYILRRQDGTEVARIVSSKEEESFNYNLPGYRIEVRDSTDTAKTSDLDPISERILKRYWKFLSDPGGDLNDSKTLFNLNIPGFNGFAALFPAYRYMGTDSLFNSSIWNTPFDHTKNYSTYECPFDELVCMSYKSGSSIETRRCLKIAVDTKREPWKLSNDGNQYSTSYSTDDIIKRPDGSNHNQVTCQPGFCFPGYYCMSFGADKAINYGVEIIKKFCTRYAPAINDGTILGVGSVYATSGEMETTFTYDENGQSYNPPLRNIGDFNVQMRTKFMQFVQKKYPNISTFNTKYGTSFPSYSIGNWSGDAIANGNSKIKNLYSWFQMTKINDFEELYSTTVRNLGIITRTKFWFIDVGALIDGVVERRNFLFFDRIQRYKQSLIMFKSNNNTEQYNDFVCDMILSGARVGGCIATWEPSPMVDMNLPNGRNQAVTAINKMKTVGVSLSAFPPANAGSVWTSISNDTGLSSFNSVVHVDDLNSNGTLLISSTPLSVALVDANAPESNYRAVQTANPGKRVNIRIVDDIKSFFDS